MRAAFGIAALLVAACSTDQALTLPSVEAASAIVVALGGNGGPQVFGLDFPGEVSREILVSEGEALEVYAAYYSCSLAWVGVTQGGPQLTASGSPFAWTIAEEVWTSQDTDEGVRPWQALDPGDPSLMRLQLDQPKPGRLCESLSYERVLLPGTDLDCHVTLAVAVDEAHVLFGFDAPIAPVLVGPEGAAPISVLPPVAYLGGYVTADGELFVATATGAMKRGTLAGGFVAAGQLNAIPGYAPPFGARFVGSGRGEPFELYVYSLTATLERFDGVAWQVVGLTATVSADGAVDMIRLGPEELLLAPGNSEQVFVAVGERLRAETPLVGDKVRSLGSIPGFGPLAGMNSGRVMQRFGPGVWHDLGASNLGHDARAFAPFGNGFITGGGFGGFTVQYHPEARAFCPIDPGISIEFTDLLPIDGDLIAVPRRKDPGPLSAIRMGRPEARPQTSCRPGT